jgi:hypothetical protein
MSNKYIIKPLFSDIDEAYVSKFETLEEAQKEAFRLARKHRISIEILLLIGGYYVEPRYWAEGEDRNGTP